MLDTSHDKLDDQAARRLAAIVESLDDVIVDINLDGVIARWSSKAEHFYGYPGDEVTGCSFAILLSDDDQRVKFDKTLEQIRAGQCVGPADCVQCVKDGRLVNVSLTVSPVRDASGQVAAGVVVTRPRVLSERSNNTSDSPWQALIESAVDGIIVIDGRGRIEVFNPAAEQLFGYSAGEMVGKSVSRLMPAPECDEHDGHIARYLTTGVRKVIGIGRQVTGLRRDGTLLPLRLSVGEMKVHGERKFVGVLHDLTARMQLEEQLRERTTMARIGEMAAILAHEVRNPLAGIRGAVQVIGRRLPATSGDATMVAEILTRIDTLESLMKDLLLFARPPTLRLRATDLGQVIAATSSLTKEDPLFHGVRLESSGTAPPIVADPDALKIVLLNLFLNCAQAMNGQGVVHVSLESTEECSRIAVADHGPGIPPEVREKLFTPFFTTKARGTGLGLSVAQQIVKAHHGDIRVESPPHGGTTVVVTLPIAGESPCP